jgi:membrane-associated protease RseP (regulator of RpoE activity)
VTGALSFSFPLLAILFAHEMGHYLMCRRYGIDASPPYFIPFPSLVGTMGAFIRIREPFRTKTQLFDVGVAGPIAGFVVALPILVYGMAHTRVNPGPIEGGTLIFHYPLLVTILQKLLLGSTFTSMDVIEHPAFVAGWFGLFVTALNLVPIGQLDGGHALYAIAGRHTRKIVLPLLAVVVGLGFKFAGWWFWAALLLIMGIRHPRLVDEDAPLDPRRKAVAAVILAMFVLCFTPIPIEETADLPAGRPPMERGGTVVHQLHLHRGAERPS